MSVVYEEIALADGRIEIEDADSGKVVGAVDGVGFTIRPTEENGVLVAGEVKTGEVRLFDLVAAAESKARVSVRRGRIDITEIEIPTAGGPIVGRAVVGGTAGSPFQLELVGAAIDAAALAKEFSRGEAWVSGGEARLKLRMRGHASRPGAVLARLHLKAEELALGQRETRGRASVVVDLVRGKVRLSAAKAELDGRLIRAAGLLGSDGLLRINTRLYTAGDTHMGFARRAAALRPEAPPLRFAHLDGTDWHYVDFPVSGGVRDPRADLWHDGAWRPLPQLVEQLLDDPVTPTQPIGELAPVSL